MLYREKLRSHGRRFVNLGVQWMGMIDLVVWKRVMCGKLLWNLSSKADKMWVKWIHAFYMKNEDVVQIQPKQNMSWILKGMLKIRSEILGTQTWSNLELGRKFPSGKLYRELMHKGVAVPWRKLFYNNIARPRALFTLWLTCLQRLYTKDRLKRFGLTGDEGCCWCNEDESIEHLFFACAGTEGIWTKVLEWLQIVHKPMGWSGEISWIMTRTNGNKSGHRLVKCAFAEMVYYVWNRRNRIVHGGCVGDDMGWREVCSVIVARSTRDPVLNARIEKLDKIFP